MGGTSTSKQTQSSTLSPYDPANSSLQGILSGINNLVPQAGTLSSGQQGAINQVVSNSNGTPNYSQPINNGVGGLLNGGGAQNNDAAIKSNLGDAEQRNRWTDRERCEYRREFRPQAAARPDRDRRDQPDQRRMGRRGPRRFAWEHAGARPRHCCR
jgi:hypothetical protein